MSRIAYTVAEVAEAVGKTEGWVTKQLRAKRLKGTRLTKGWTIPAPALAEFVGMPTSEVTRLMREAV